MYLKIILILFLLKIQLSLQNEDDKPAIQDLLVSSKLIEGKKLFLSCQASSQHPMQFEWYFNKQKIEQDENIYIVDLKDNSILNINSMTIKNSGVYTCQVSNSYGSDSKEVNLQLNSKFNNLKINDIKLIIHLKIVKPKFKKEPEDLLIKLNTEIEINCDAFAIPEPKIKIQKLSSKGNLEQEFEQKKLKFNFTKASSNRFRCFIENELGSIQKEIQIKHYGKF